MSGTIKGITIEIGGSTSKLQEALDKAKKATSSLNYELRAVSRLLKVNPNSVTALSQKQQILNEKIAVTKEKLDALKQAKEKALNDGLIDKTSAEYRDLERKIEGATNSLKAFEKEQRAVIAQSTKLGQISTKLEGISKKAHEVADKYRGISLASGLLLGGAIKIGADFEKEMSKVSAISGATGDNLEKLKIKAREMGSKTEFSAKQSAEAMNYMAMAGWKTTEMIDGLDGVMNLASASGEELAVVSDIVTDGLTAFGLKAKDSSHFADVLAVASSNANTNVSLMGETFKYVAPVAGALGFTIEDTAEAIGLMANMGIKGSQSGTALRIIMNNLSKDFEVTGRNLGKVKIHTTNADGSMRSLRDILKDTREAFSKLTDSEKAQSAEALVGKNAMVGFLALMNSSPQDIGKLQKAIDGANGTAKKMADTMRDNLYGDLVQLKSSSEELAMSLGEGLRPTLRVVTKIIKAFSDMLSKMPKGFKTAIATSMLLSASIYPLGKVVGYASGSISKITKLMSFMAGKSDIASDKVGLLGRVLNKIPRSPLLIAGTVGIGVGIAVINDVIGKLNRVKNEIKAIEKAGTDKIRKLDTEGLVNERHFKRLQELSQIEDKNIAQKKEMKNIVEILNENVQGLNLSYDEEKDKLNEGIEVIGRKIKAYNNLAKAEAYKESQKEFIQEQIKLEKEQSELLERKYKIEQQIANERRNGDGTRLAQYYQELTSVEGELKRVEEGIKSAGTKAQQMGNMQFFSELLTQAQTAGIEVPKSLENGIKAGFIKVPQTMEELNLLIDSKLGELVEYANQEGIAIPQELSKGIKGGEIGVAEASSQIKALLQNKLNVDGETLGRNIAKGLERGLSAGSYSLGITAGKIANSVFEIMNRKAETRSPSRRSMRLGKYIGQGLSIGLNKEGYNVEKAGRNLANRAFGHAKLLGGSNKAVSSGISADLSDTIFQTNGIDYGKLGAVFVNALKNTDIGISLNGRELARGLEGIGVKFG